MLNGGSKLLSCFGTANVRSCDQPYLSKIEATVPLPVLGTLT